MKLKHWQHLFSIVIVLNLYGFYVLWEVFHDATMKEERSELAFGMGNLVALLLYLLDKIEKHPEKEKK